MNGYCMSCKRIHEVESPVLHETIGDDGRKVRFYRGRCPVSGGGMTSAFALGGRNAAVALRGGSATHSEGPTLAKALPKPQTRCARCGSIMLQTSEDARFDERRCFQCGYRTW